MRRMRAAALTGALLAATLGAGAGVFAATAESPIAAGKAIYRYGALPSGTPVKGARESGANVSGRAAACENCHRRSGLGYVEGNILIPPITEKYLYRRRSANVTDMTMAHVAGFVPRAGAYDDASLGRLIRTGIRPNGSALNPVMPRYALDQAAMASLLAYLRTLGSRPARGVSETTLDFATIVTPDADPAGKEAMLAVLERFFAVQNRVIAGEVRPMHASREIMYRVTRKWRLHVWELSGPPAAWRRQLDDHLAAEPVFAVISGLGGRDWGPIHRFCEQNRVPCLLPNVDLPVVAEDDFYPVYYSRGVLLEADLIAARLFAPDTPQPRRLVEVYRAGDIGGAAAAALERRAKHAAVELDRRVLPAKSADRGETASALRQAFAGVRPAMRSCSGCARTISRRSGENRRLRGCSFPASWPASSPHRCRRHGARRRSRPIPWIRQNCVACAWIFRSAGCTCSAFRSPRKKCRPILIMRASSCPRRSATCSTASSRNTSSSAWK